MAAHTLRSLCRPPLGLLAARFSQRAAAETEYRSIYSLDKLYPPRQDGNAAAASAPVSGAGGGAGKASEGRALAPE